MGCYGHGIPEADGPGNREYDGRAQTTIASGNLYLFVKAYVEAPGARFAAILSEYLSALIESDSYVLIRPLSIIA